MPFVKLKPEYKVLPHTFAGRPDLYAKSLWFVSRRTGTRFYTTGHTGLTEFEARVIAATLNAEEDERAGEAQA